VATIIKRQAEFGFGVAWIDFYIDDVALEVFRVVAINNDSYRTLLLDVTSPKTLTRSLSPNGGTLDISIPPGQRIPISQETDYHGNTRWGGITWSGTLGI
jgi:hypothetical protein